MIGILCSNDMENEYAKKLHSLFKNIRNESDESMIVFVISNIDFKNKLVKGSLISDDNLKTVEVPLPPVIFNFSLQRDDAGIKSRKALEEMEEIRLINYINKFDQWMIMEIMSSCSDLRKYLLPYYIYYKSKRNYKPEDDKSYITMPARGASLDRVIFAQPDPKTDIIRGTQYFKKGHICDYIDASLCQQRWIFLEVPNLILRNNNPVVVRVYMQKNTTKTWMILGEKFYPGITEEAVVLESIDAAAVTIIEEINKFLPSLGHCFIDFVLSTEGKPYFLHIGGIDQYFFKQQQEQDIYKKFYKNLLSLARYHRAT